MKKRPVALIIAAALIAVSISACSPEAAPAQTPDTQGQQSVVSENTSEQTDEGAQGDQNTADSSAQENGSTQDGSSADGSSQNSAGASEAGTQTSQGSNTQNSGSTGQSSGNSQTVNNNNNNNQSGNGGNSGGNSGNTGNSGGNSGNGNSGSTGNTGNSGGNSGNSGSTGNTGNSGGNSGNGSSGSTGNSGGSRSTTPESSSGGSGKSGSGGSSGGKSGSSKSSTPESSKESSQGGSSSHSDETPFIPLEPSQTETSKPDTKKTDKSESAVGDEDTYKSLFSTTTKVVVKIDMTKSEIDKLQADYNKYKNKADAKSEIYRKADVTFTIGKDTYKLDEVGVRLKGNNTLAPIYASNGSPNIVNFKLSFDETFDDKTEYGSDAKVWASDAERKKRKKRTFATLNGMDIKWNVVYDDTFVREIYATKLFEASDVMVQKINLANVEFNGSNYGVMKIYEPIDKNFLEKRLPESALGGDLYKALWSNRTSSGGTTGWRGAEYTSGTSYGIQSNKDGIKYNYNLKTNKKTSKHESIKNFLSVINKSNPTKSEIESVVDTGYFAKFMAACYFAGGPDDIRNNYNNHYIYFRKDNGKAVFIPYDNDRTLGITIGYNPDGKACSERNPYTNKAAGNNDTERNPLILKTITTSGLSSLSYIKDMYTAQLRTLAGSDLMSGSAKFNTLYNSAKRNYESVVTPSVNFKNQKKTFKFSLDGSKNGGDSTNMSFEQFRSAILDTYRKYVN